MFTGTGSPMTQPATINDIFRADGESYRKRYPQLSLPEKKVMRSIETCRTEILGGRIEECDACDYEAFLYNSCRNRHCPLCQFMKKEAWIAQRKKEVLPFTYFHVVLTLPHQLNPIVSRNKRLIYDLLFQKCKETLFSVSGDKKYFGAKIGFFAILHTWGQKLNRHPHLHCVVPGGGYSEDKKAWIQTSKKFLLPVDVLKPRFRKLFLKGLKVLHSSNKLYLAGTPYVDPGRFQDLIDSLFSKDWVVYIKKSFHGEEKVIEYLARYTHRIAISNYRILKFENDRVTFSYKDYNDGNKKKIMELSSHSFIYSFLRHVVPQRFVRIRYYGLFANRNKKKAIEACREFHGIEVIEEEPAPLHWTEIYLRVTGKKVNACPVCENGTLRMTKMISSIRYRGPPAAGCLEG